MIPSAANSSLLYIAIAGVAATAVWRIAGVVISNGLAEESPLIEWVKAVSTALVAGLVTRIVLFPPGALADIELAIRAGSFTLGIAAFFVARRNLAFGVLAGTLMLISAHLISG